MKIFKFFAIFILIVIIFCSNNARVSIAKISLGDNKISNYFLGVVSLQAHKSQKALRYFSKVKDLKNTHLQFNKNLTNTFVNLRQIKEAQKHLKQLPVENINFFEASLLLGLYEQSEGNFEDAEYYFLKLNSPSEENLYYNDFLGNFLIAWSKASQKKYNEANKYLDNISGRYENIKILQRPLLNCFFKKKDKTQIQCSHSWTLR